MIIMGTVVSSVVVSSVWAKTELSVQTLSLLFLCAPPCLQKMLKFGISRSSQHGVLHLSYLAELLG